MFTSINRVFQSLRDLIVIELKLNDEQIKKLNELIAYFRCELKSKVTE